MRSYDKSIEAIPGIIREAATNQLGLLALLAVVVAVVAISFFALPRLTTKNGKLLLAMRLTTFLVLFSGAFALGRVVVGTLPKSAVMATEVRPAAQTSDPVGSQRVQQLRRSSLTDGRTSQYSTFSKAIQRAEAFEGGPNVPGNMGQACEAYSEALQLVYNSLTQNERELLQLNTGQCSKGKSGEYIPALKQMAHQVAARTTQQ